MSLIMEQSIDREPPETEQDERDLKPMERKRIARLMLKLAGDGYAAPGSFWRSHEYWLDRQIRAGDVNAAKARRLRSSAAKERTNQTQ
jgi:hypothetical protein